MAQGQLRSARAARLPEDDVSLELLLEPIVVLPEPELLEPLAEVSAEPLPDVLLPEEPEAPIVVELLPEPPLAAPDVVGWLVFDGSPPGPGFAAGVLPVVVDDDWATAAPASARAAVPASRTLRSLEALIAFDSLETVGLGYRTCAVASCFQA
jgi:hypothetical protein